MLFSDKRRHALSIPARDVERGSKPATVASLIDYLCKSAMTDSRQELFVLNGQLYVFSLCPPSGSDALSGYPHALPFFLWSPSRSTPKSTHLYMT